jgi:uncharacterized protein
VIQQSWLRACVVASSCLLATSQAAADPESDAQSAFMAGNYEKAATLYRPLAEQGGARAQYVLGNLYRNGYGVRKDDKAAVKWYQLSAEQGDVDAQYSLAESYYKGQGVLQDYKKAAKWYRLAALHGSGSPAPQFLLGMMLLKGEGVPQDYVSAHMWLNLSSANAIAVETQRQYAKARDSAAKAMTVQQVAEAQARAKKCVASEYKKC